MYRDWECGEKRLRERESTLLPLGLLSGCQKRPRKGVLINDENL